MKPSFLNPEYDSEILQKLVERMMRAGWIAGTAVVTPGPFAFVWSPIGQERIVAIEKVLRKYGPTFFDGTAKKMGTLKYLIMCYRIAWLAKGLIPPRLSLPEERTLFAVVIMNARGKTTGEKTTSDIQHGRFKF